MPIPMTDEQAKMAQEIAKASGPVVGLVRDVGRTMVRSTIGAIPGDLIGLVGGDWLHEVRKRNRARLEAQTATLLDGIDKSRISEPSPSVVLPLLEAAMDESREELQDLWARLLANAMIDGGSKVRREFFTTLETLEPIDAVVLELFPLDQARPQDDEVDLMVRILNEREVKGVSHDQVSVSLQTLTDCRCIERSNNARYVLMPYGRQFLAACRVE